MNIQKQIFIGKRFPGKITAFVNLVEASRIIVGSTNSNRRNFSRSPILVRFRNYESPGSYTQGRETIDVLKQIYKNPKGSAKELYHIWKEEFKLWGKELHHHISDNYKHVVKGDIDMLFTFDHEKCFNNWILTTDSTNNQGYSTAKFSRTNCDTALFTGNISTRLPKDGKTQYAGFASILTSRLLKSFKRFSTYDWSHYTHMVLKLRGDGRTYLLILGCPGKYDLMWQDQYHYPLYTRGGPYWQIVKIPFSNFYFTSKGRIQDQQFTMDLNACSRVGITIADGIDGPFKLEIEYFGLEYQPLHKEICPYEGYYMGNNVAD